VFEEVCEPRTSGWIILTADAIADVDGNRRDPMILDEEDA
jgi:hypothetical protein